MLDKAKADEHDGEDDDHHDEDDQHDDDEDDEEDEEDTENAGDDERPARRIWKGERLKITRCTRGILKVASCTGLSRLKRCRERFDSLQNHCGMTLLRNILT